MSNTTYDRIKIVAQYILPALATLYFALAEIWDLPARAQVVATITALDTFLGVILGVTSKNYKKGKDDEVSGDIEVSVDDDGRMKFLLALKSEKAAQELPTRGQATFNILT